MPCSVALRRCLVFQIAIVAVHACAVADDFATSANNCRLSEMNLVTSYAADCDFRIAQLVAHRVGSQIRFDYVLEPNISGDAWFVHFNLTDAKLDKLEEGFAEQGFTRVIESAVQFRGSRRSTVVWQKIFPPRPLLLPTAAVPVNGHVSEEFRSFDQTLQKFLVHHNLVGATVAIARQQDIVYSRAFGYSDVNGHVQMSLDSEMRIASLSKIVTATAVMKLVQQEKLSLDEFVLPRLQEHGFELPSPIAKLWGQITVRQLLNHRGGWDKSASEDPLFEAAKIARKLNLRREVTARDVVKYQLGQPVDYSPGTQQVYSNFGYLLLGQLIEQAAGSEYEDAIQYLVLQPSRMIATRIGRTRVVDRSEREVCYHMQNSTCHRPFWAFRRKQMSDLIPHVDAPDGQWDLQVLSAAAGWVSTAEDIVRLSFQMDESIIAANSVKNDCWSCGWKVQPANCVGKQFDLSMDGYLAGSSALLLRIGDMACAVLFNTDDSIHGGSAAMHAKPIVRTEIRKLATRNSAR